MKILAARKYPNPRNGSLTRAEAETRRIAYAIKDPRSPSIDFDTAGREMAALILASHPHLSTINPQPFSCWLVPIPASDGSTRANTILAAHIARHVSLSASWREGWGEVALNQLSTLNHQLCCCQIARALRRAKPIESQCARHRRNLPSTPHNAHHLKATLWSLGNHQIYFVDNVATSGNTMRAAFAAMQRGAGLVFAAVTRHTGAKPEPILL